MNEVTNFMYYMYNKWGLNECSSLFGLSLGEHIWNKYENNKGSDILYWYASLDNACRQKLVDRANELYGKQAYRRQDVAAVIQSN